MVARPVPEHPIAVREVPRHLEPGRLEGGHPEAAGRGQCAGLSLPAGSEVAAGAL